MCADCVRRVCVCVVNFLKTDFEQNLEKLYVREMCIVTKIRVNGKIDA